MLADLKFACRQLTKSPVFTAVAVLSLALGIGANTAIFSLVNAVLLRALPVPNPQELRVLKWMGRDTEGIGNVTGTYNQQANNRVIGDMFSYPVWTAVRAESTSLAGVFGYYPVQDATVRGKSEAVMAQGLMVSDNFFSALGVRTQFGRILTREDEQDGAESTTVISHALWQQQFGRDPDVLGQVLRINGQSYTIVGVLAADFSGPSPADQTAFYVSMAAQPHLAPSWPRTASDRWWVQAMARMKPKTNAAQFQAALDVVFARQAEGLMKEPAMVVQDGSGGPSYDRVFFRKPLLLLLGVVGVVMLVACANLAGLSLARGAAREHEYAVRAAIGAGGWRLLRQSLVESLTLALLGAGLGVLLALWSKTGMARLLAGSSDGLRYDTSLDVRVLGFTLLTALIAALLSGLLPAWRASRAGPLAGMRARTSAGSPRLRVGRILVAAQVALSLLLLTGAGLYGRTLLNLVQINPGFATDDVLLVRLNARNAGYRGEDARAFFGRVESSLARIPGVRSVTLSQFALLGNRMSGGGFFTLPGHPTSGDDRPRAHRLTVSESFFSTMQIPVVLGRGFTPADGIDAPKVVVVNESFAQKYFPGEGPLGHALRIRNEDWQIVGVARDAKYTNIKVEIPITVYFTYRQDAIGQAYVALRSPLPSAALAPAVRRAVADIDPDVPVSNVSTQQAMFDRNISQERLFATLCGALAGLALLLSCIGLYGLMAFNVTRRTGEIGIRMAIGALPRDVARPIVREALLLGIVGVVLGIPATLALTRLIKSQLYQVTTTDPAAYIAAAVLLLAVAALAAWLPARRAARVDPIIALRAD